MEELPICSLLTNKSRQRRAQSELLHASSASSSPASASVLALPSSHKSTPEAGHAEDVQSQAMQMHELAASGRIQCEKNASLMKDPQQQEASSCMSSSLERGNDAELGCRVENTKRQETSSNYCTSPKSADTELYIPQKDKELREASLCTPTLLERANDAEDSPVAEGAYLQETSSFLSGIDDTEQAVLLKVEMSTRVSVGEDYAQHSPQQNVQESILHVPTAKRTEDNIEQAIQQMKGKDISTQVSTTIKESEGTEHTADDMEHVSEIRNMGSKEISTSISSSSHRTSDACTLPPKNVELQETSTHTSMIELSLHQHLQQGDAVKEEAAMRSFIMHRFLPAAKEVAAEHESSIASLVSHSEAPTPSSPPQFQRVPIAHRIKSRVQQAPKGFISSRPLHSWHQEDGMPLSMRSCGFFCLGLKTALFRAHRTVSASARSTLRKKSWAPHPSNHTKVGDEDTSLKSSEMEGPVVEKKEAMRGVTNHQNAKNEHVPISHCVRSSISGNVQESPRRHATTNELSRRCCPSSNDCTNVGCKFPFNQSGKANLAGNQFENVKSMQSPVVDPFAVRNFLSAALKEQDYEVAQEAGLAPCNQKGTCNCKSTCVCHHVNPPPPHDLERENTSSSTLQDYMGGLETKIGKLGHDYDLRSARKNGNDEEDDDLQFFDALSRLNSVKSNATFYTLGSPRSECEALGFEGEGINDGVGFTDALSHFETPRASTSKNKSVLSHTCAATEKGMSGKMSSLSQRIGKGLKLETESKQAKSPSKRDPCAYEQKQEPHQAEIQSESFSRLRHSSLGSMSGLYAAKTSPISPVFPAKCQNSTPNALGWPFGISSYQSSRVGVSQHRIQQEKTIEKYEVCGNVPSPPLPPSPTESWLGKAVTKNASKTSPLAILQQKEKVGSARKKLDFIAVDPDAERRWENVVKGSQLQLGHLRFSEELQHHPSNLNPIKPLKL